MREAMPGWLRAVGRARLRRGGAVRCALSLITAVFPGSNRHHTSPRLLYADTLRKPLLGARAVAMALSKVREPTGISTAALHTLLRRCSALLRQLQPLVGSDLDGEIAALELLRASHAHDGVALHTPGAKPAPAESSGPAGSGAVGLPSTSSPLAPAGSSTALALAPTASGKRPTYPSPLTAPAADRPSAAKRRRLGLAASVGGAGGSRSKFVEGIISWFERMLAAHDIVSKFPLAEVAATPVAATLASATPALATLRLSPPRAPARVPVPPLALATPQVLPRLSQCWLLT